MSVRVLIIDSDSRAATQLERKLAGQGFRVTKCHDGRKGLALASSRSHDILILDVSLADGNGWAILTELRRSNAEIPIVLVSALSQVEDRVRGLRLGADDYLAKPFSFSELLARIRSILRRSARSWAHLLRIDDLQVDLVRRRASRCGQPLDLTPTELGILILMIRKAGAALTHAEITAAIWGADSGSDSNTVRVNVHRLRQKIDVPFDRKLVRSIRGVGYVLEPPAKQPEGKPTLHGKSHRAILGNRTRSPLF